MTVYVDTPRAWGLRGYSGKDAAQAERVGARHGHMWCHMFADEADCEELHDLAQNIGMKREWFQRNHYDLTPPKRALAIRMGAQEVSDEQSVAIWRKQRAMKAGELGKAAAMTLPVGAVRRPPWAERVVGFDTETTGTDENARIVEIGIVLWEDGQVVVKMPWLLNPGDVNLDDPEVRRAFEVNQIDPATLVDKPTFAEVFPEIRNGLAQAQTRVAHNAAFDQRMLRQEFKRAVAEGKLAADALAIAPGTKFMTLCTLGLDIYLNPRVKGRSLAATAERWGVGDWEKHRAIGDAHACLQILEKMARQLPDDMTEVVPKMRDLQATHQRNIERWFASKRQGATA